MPNKIVYKQPCLFSTLDNCTLVLPHFGHLTFIPIYLSRLSCILFSSIKATITNIDINKNILLLSTIVDNFLLAIIYDVYGGRHYMIEYNKKSVGKTIKKLRQSKGSSQEVLSSFAGIARSHLSMIENGTKQANLETIFKIASALNIYPHELVKLIEEEAEME